MLIEEAKVLIVGAGGIGCELLKNAVLSGFRNIHIVDLDTIELSNLNRQFLFRRRHIGMPKAVVAREAALKMAPTASITAHFASIFDTTNFSLTFFKGFDVVMNALDNLAARRYVNGMCLMARVPLIESGTAGYLGQTSVILNRKTECFDCVAKETPKTFPVCTIRSTPSAPIHCIIWAKEFLLPNLFGQDSSVSIDDESSDALKDTWTSEQLAFDSLKQFKKDPELFYKSVVKKLFIDDIEKIRGIQELWKDRVSPEPLSEDELINASNDFDYISANDHEVWNLSDWISLFKSSILRLLTRSINESEICFDKDDSDTLDFVASSANIRSKIFNIKMESKFEIKAIAGNIIPAIATTNAIAASMIIVHARNILNGDQESLCNAYINYGSLRNVFSIEKPCKPNPECSTCSCDRAVIKLNCETFTIKKLIESVLPLYLNELKSKFPENDIKDIDEDDLMVLEGNRLLYDIDDDNGNGSKPLKELEIFDSKFLKIDLSPRRPLLLGVIHVDDHLKSTFEIDFDLIEPKPEPVTVTTTATEDSGDSENDIVCIDEKDYFIEITEICVKKAKIETN